LEKNKSAYEAEMHIKRLENTNRNCEDEKHILNKLLEIEKVQTIFLIKIFILIYFCYIFYKKLIFNHFRKWF